MSKDESKDDYFNPAFRHNLVQEFCIAYYNKDFKPDVALKSETSGQDAHWYSDSTIDLEKWKGEPGVISYIDNGRVSSAGYRYSVILRDSRFKELDALVEKYFDPDTPSADKLNTEKELYKLVRILMKDNRIPKSFKMQPFRDAQLESIAMKQERTVRLLDALEKRVASLEDLAEKIPR